MYQLAFLLGANGQAKAAALFLPAHSELAHDPILLRCLLIAEARAKLPPACPRIIAAARVGNRERLSELIVAGADIRSLDRQGHTCLIEAARCGRIEAVQFLIHHLEEGECGLLDVRIPAEHADAGHTAFSIACLKSHYVIARELAPRTQPDSIAGGGGSAFEWACEARLVNVVAEWLNDVDRCPPSVIAARDSRGMSAFERACQSACDKDRVLSLCERNESATIARMLAPHMNSEDIPRALYWMCMARLYDLISLSIPLVSDYVALSAWSTGPGPWTALMQQPTARLEACEVLALRKSARVFVIEARRLLQYPDNPVIRSALFGISVGVEIGPDLKQLFHEKLDTAREDLARMRTSTADFTKVELDASAYLSELKALQLSVADAALTLGEYVFLCSPPEYQNKALLLLSEAVSLRNQLLPYSDELVLEAAASVQRYHNFQATARRG